MKKLRRWTPEDDQYLRDNYPNESQKNLGLALNRSDSAIQNRGRILGLNKSEEYMANSDNLSRYKKGHVPHSKGKPMSSEQYAKCKATMFKKGIVPKNTAKVGDIRESRNYKRGTVYLLIKAAEPNKWKLLHRHIWENEHGMIAKRMNVVFKDGNSLNCKLDNLELIDNVEKMRRNTIHNQYPEDIVHTVQVLGALKRRIKNHGRRK